MKNQRSEIKLSTSLYVNSFPYLWLLSQIGHKSKTFLSENIIFCCTQSHTTPAYFAITTKEIIE